MSLYLWLYFLKTALLYSETGYLQIWVSSVFINRAKKICSSRLFLMCVLFSTHSMCPALLQFAQIKRYIRLVLSLLSYQWEDMHMNRFPWCNVLYAVMLIYMKYWGITDLWAITLRGEIQGGGGTGIGRCHAAPHSGNDLGILYNTLKTSVEWAELCLSII